MDELRLLIPVLCLLIWLVFAFYIFLSLWFTTPYYPSRVKKLSEAFKDLKIKYDENTKFIDIGSGDGRIVLWAAKMGMNSKGIELNPFLTLFSRFLLLMNGVTKKGDIINGNFNHHDYSSYDIVYMYILNEHMRKLEDRLFLDMKAGSIIISNTFTFANHKPDREFGRFKVYVVK